jgi:hypothetical protein
MSDERYTIRGEMLRLAAELVTNQRNKTYGEPDEDFQRIAAVASALGFRMETKGSHIAEHRSLTGSDVSLFMVALKLSRLTWSPAHDDSWTDIAGYAACGLETAKLEEQRAAGAAKVDLTPDTSETLWGNEVRLLADKAIAGDPKYLEDAGWILIDAPGPSNCADRCGGGHLFHSRCGYRIKRRRGASDVA